MSTSLLKPLFLSGGGDVSSSDILDSTAAGRALLTAADETAQLAATRVNGYQSLASIPQKTWRLVTRLRWDQEALSAGTQFGQKFRSLRLGDSVRVDLSKAIAGHMGYGGESVDFGSYNTSGSVHVVPQALATGGTYAAWTAGVYSVNYAGVTSEIQNAFSRNPSGHLIYLDASFTGGTYITLSQIQGPFHEARVDYLASSTGGSFKLQYQANKTGSWIDATVATAAGNDPGSAASGVVSTNNGGPDEMYSTAVFSLPDMDRYNLRVVATSGRVALCNAYVSAGAFGQASTALKNLGAVCGGMDVDMGNGGKSLGNHFRYSTATTLAKAIARINPHVITYKSLNGYTLSDYQAYWPTYAANVMAAAPNALFIVAGSHPIETNPTNSNANHTAVDDYLRNWCSVTPGAVFVDVRQNFPAYQSAGTSVDDLWSDTVHIYDGDSGGGYAGGTHYVSMLVWDIIRPALDYSKLLCRFNNRMNMLPGFWNEIRTFGTDDATAAAGKSSFYITRPPRVAGGFYLKPSSSNVSGSTIESLAGFAQAATDDAVNPNSLSLISDGMVGCRLSTHTSYRGQYAGVAFGPNIAASRSQSGGLFLGSNPSYGAFPSLTVETYSGAASTTPILRLGRGGTASAEGSPLWEWLHNGSVVYEGTTNDAYETTFTYDEPAADVTVHNAVGGISGTGAKPRYVFAAPGYANAAAAAADSNLPSGVLYYDESAGGGRIKP